MTQPDNDIVAKSQASNYNSALVSIIIPAYNTAPYIHRAIGSSLRQTHKNIEVIVIDDGSTDDTLRVAEYFAGTDSRIRVLTQKNAGVSAARNHGIREAKGEYFVFLDSDDWLEDYAVEALLEAQSEYPDKVICANSCWGVKIGGSRLYRTPKDSRSISSRFFGMKDIAEGYCFFPNTMRGFHCVNAKLFRASFNITFPEGVKYGEDAVFFIKYLCKVNGAYYLSKSIVNVLERQGSATRSLYNPEYADSLVEEYKIICNLVRNNEEIRELMLMSQNIYLYGEPLKKAIEANVSNSEIHRIRNLIKPYVHYTLRCKRYSLKTKIHFFLAVYAPVPVYKAFYFILKSLKALKKPREEIITNWQDFPKAPSV